MQVRNNYLDFVKGIAIILVIVGHTVQYSFGEDFYENPLFIFIYSFHMPFFMAISGYLFYYSEKKPISEIIKKRFHQLIIPLFLWTFILTISMLSKKHENSLIDALIFYLKLLPREYWFLLVLFLSTLILYFTNTYLNRWYYHVLIVILILLIPDFSGSMFLKFMYPFFLLGFLYNHYALYINKYISYILIFSLIVFITGLYIWKMEYFIYFNESQILYKDGFSYNHLQINTIRFFVGISGSILVFYLLKLMFDKIKFRSIQELGKETLGIYLVHYCLLDIISYRQFIIIENAIYLQIFLNSLLLLAVSYSAVKVLRKWDISKKYLLGENPAKTTDTLAEKINYKIYKGH